MREELKQLGELLKADKSGDVIISKELYGLLQKEYEEIQELLKLAEQSRKKGSSEIIPLDTLLSEEIFEFSIPEIGVEDEVLEFKKNKYRYHSDKDFDVDRECPLPREEYRKIMKKVDPLLRDRGPICCGEEGILEVFKKKPKGKIIGYDILQDCYAQEFMKSLLSTNMFDKEEMLQYTMNPLQLAWLFKTGILQESESYVALMLLNGKVTPIQSIKRRGTKYNNSVTWDDFDQIKKNKKFLLFCPSPLNGNFIG